VWGPMPVTTAPAADRPGSALARRPAWDQSLLVERCSIVGRLVRLGRGPGAYASSRLPANLDHFTPVPRVEAWTVGAVNDVAPVNDERVVAAVDFSGDTDPTLIQRQAPKGLTSDNKADSLSGVDHPQGVVLPADSAGLRRLETPARLRDRPAPNPALSTPRLASWTGRTARGLGFACG